MFTGIIENLGKIEEVKKTPTANKTHKTKPDDKNGHHTEITISLEKFRKLKVGDSIAINGVC